MSHFYNQVNPFFVFPLADGTPNQVMKTDGSGQLSWSTFGLSVNVSTLLDQDYNPLSYSSSNNEEYYIMNPTGTRTLTLPSISSNSIPEGYKVNVKNMNASNTINIQPNSGDSNEIDGSTSIVHSLSTQYENITFVCDGSNIWYRV